MQFTKKDERKLLTIIILMLTPYHIATIADLQRAGTDNIKLNAIPLIMTLNPTATIGYHPFWKEIVNIVWTIIIAIITTTFVRVYYQRILPQIAKANAQDSDIT